MTQQAPPPSLRGEPDVGAGLPIQAVSRLLEVPAPTIRSWERRYGVPPTSRSSGGHRRFFRDELMMLRRMRDEIARGRRAADAATAVLDALRRPSPYQQRVDAALNATTGHDSSRLRGALVAAHDELGLDDAVTAVLLPLMRQVGRWWEEGRCDVASEQFATQVVRGWLAELRQQAAVATDAPAVALAAGPRDAHTIGLEAMSVLLSARGIACRLLGPRSPARPLAAAVDACGATVLIGVSHLSVARRAAVEELRTVPASRVRLFYAGNAFVTPQSRAGVPGSYLGEDLLVAREAVQDAVRSASIRRRPAAAERAGV